MSIQVKLSWAERFLNWFPSHTRLYIRGQKGKSWEEQRALDTELAQQLSSFFATMARAIREEERAVCAERRKWVQAYLVGRGVPPHVVASLLGDNNE